VNGVEADVWFAEARLTQPGREAARLRGILDARS
jgi:hypothetical protein